MTDGNAAWLDATRRFGTTERDILDFLDPPPLVPTGMGGVDAVLSGGMAPGTHVLMARPGAGKSALALHVALNVARAGGRVLFASCEMTRQQCLARLCAELANTTGGMAGFYWSGWEQMGAQAKREMAQWRFPDDDARLEYASRFSAVQALWQLRAKAPGLVVSDGPGIGDATELCETVGALSARGLGLVVVDYLQRLRPPKDVAGAKEHERVGRMMSDLTLSAKVARVPILVISSMGRESQRSDTPDMSGARGSGEVEYDATTVMLLRRRRGDPDGGVRSLELHVMKNRRGPVTEEERPLLLRWDVRRNVFEEEEVGNGE